MTVRQRPGQLELPLNEPFLTDEVRAELTAHVLDGWQLMGQCRSVADDTWFPEDGQSRVPALAGCHACPVRTSCFAFALANNEEHGIWGGVSEYLRSVARRELSDGHAVSKVLADPTYLVFMEKPTATTQGQAA